MLETRARFKLNCELDSSSIVSSIQARLKLEDGPTKALAWWDVDGCEILGGRDEVAGGTWLACSRQGRVAFVANVWELHHLHRTKSRRTAFTFLEGKSSTKSPMEFAEQMMVDAHRYNGFNLIMADFPSKSMVYISNRPIGEPITIQLVSPGLHVLSNAKLDSPWPKVGPSWVDTMGVFGWANVRFSWE
ncbi:hypothetical protein F3Y22_tig00111996pilonHSYRG00060 [Hibiscus syriacus]|uniref:Uncharacterized protein n=1 Tax=Hibiscus syriacus TaxID=106335 RepID=A0A6A2X7W3_HIBSY|nr:hypothetical protein F3Y22_tig00111996pilonHSYRG00060 [Hibiscus syriacus]